MRKDALREYLPSYYIQDGNAAALLNAQEIELRKVEAGQLGLARAMSPGTASAEAIARWEHEYGILPPVDATLDQRRAEVWAKIRAGGTFTTETVKSLAEIYTGHIAEVEEVEDFYLKVTLHGTEAIEGYAAFVEAVMALLPAHASLLLELKWHTWGELKERDQHQWAELAGVWGSVSGEDWGSVSPVRSTWGDVGGESWDAIRWNWWALEPWEEYESSNWEEIESITWSELQGGD